MSALCLREATVQDVAVIHEMSRELAVFEELEDLFVATVEDFEVELFNDRSPATVLLAELDEEVVGMALYFPTFSTFLGKPGIWLEDLYVRSSARRSGVATALLAELTRRSPGRLEWEVLDWNEGAIELYERTGAKPFAGWIKYRVTPER